MDDRTVLMSPKPLQSGYQITWYTIEKVLGQGGFGITYLAHDNNLDRMVAIKEYLPTSFANRHRDHSVKPISEQHADQFSWGLQSFLTEAKTLAKFNHENIVRVLSVFEQNHTAYMVMDFENGENLASLIARNGSLDQSMQKRMFFPILDGLEKIHELGFIHRDIKPANIHIRDNGSPVLIDFGSARRSSQQNTSEMTTLVSQGYTPLEQYSPNYGEQGPWTDIYSLAATMYEGVTGSRPDDSVCRSAQALRSKPDRVEYLHSSVYTNYEQSFLDAVNSGLALQPDRRPQSLLEWRAQFAAEAVQPGFTAATRSSSNRPAMQTLNYESQDAIESWSGQDSEDWDVTSSPGTALNSRKPAAGKRRVKVIAGLLGLGMLAAGVSSYAYLKKVSISVSSTSSQADHSSTVEIPAATLSANTDRAALPNLDYADSDKESVSANEPAITPSPVVVEPIVVPTEVAVEPTLAFQQKIYFDQPLLNDTAVGSPRSIRELIEASPEFPPIENLDKAVWAEKSCSDCHSWERASLCKQGEFYNVGEESKLTRIRHPFDGFFKHALKQWANEGCQ